jgi:hypothetical protein
MQAKLLTTCILIAPILPLTMVGCETAQTPFDAEAWQNERDQRSRMVRSLLDDHNLVGMDRLEIHELLGAPSPPRDAIINGRYVYWAGTDGMIDDMWFEVLFTDDTVSHVRHVPD